MATKAVKIKIGMPEQKDISHISVQSSYRTQPDSQINDPAKIVEKFKNEEPLVNFERSFEELKAEVHELFADFQNFIIKEDIGTHLRALMKNRQKDEPIVLARCMKQTFKSIVKLREESAQEIAKINYANSAKQNHITSNRLETDHELLLQKAEQEIKNHIKTENQLKLLVEMLQSKSEENEKNKNSTAKTIKLVINDMRSDTAKLVDIIKAKDNEILNLNKIIQNYKEQIQSLQIQLLGIQVLEVKLRNLKQKHYKETEEMKRYYETESANLTKEIFQIHRTLSSNLAHDEKFKLMHKELQSYKDFNIRKMQVLENKVKELQDLAERASSPSYHDGRSKYQGSYLKDGELLESVSVSPQKDHNLNKDANAIRRDSIKQDPGINEIHTDQSEEDDIETRRNSAKNQIILPSPERKIIKSQDISGLRRSQTQNENVKITFEKQRKRLMQEINILSLGRTSDLNNQNKEIYHNVAYNDKQFSSYYDQLVAKLDSLTLLNEREKIELHKVDPKGYSSRYHQSRSVESSKNARMNRKNSSSMARTLNGEMFSANQTQGSIDHSKKKKNGRSLSLHKAIKEATPVALGSLKTLHS